MDYDDTGRVVLITQLGKDGKGVFDKDLGLATKREKLDANGNWTEQAFYDARDRLALGPFGFAKGVIIRGEDGRVECVNYGPDGHIMFNRLLGWARELLLYRANELLSDTFYGADGSLANGPDGFAIHTRTLDSKGRLLKEEYLDSNQKLTFGPLGYARRETKGTREVFYGTGGGLMDRVEDVVPLLYVGEVISARAAALKVGLRTGDVFWRLGDWSYPEALPRAVSEAKKPEEVSQILWSSLKPELDRAKGVSLQLTVLRDGHVVTLKFPVLPSEGLGVRVKDRSLPRAYYEQSLSRLR